MLDVEGQLRRYGDAVQRAVEQPPLRARDAPAPWWRRAPRPLGIAAAALVVATVLSLVSRGTGGVSVTTSHGMIDSCDVLRPEDAAEVLGGPTEQRSIVELAYPEHLVEVRQAAAKVPSSCLYVPVGVRVESAADFERTPYVSLGLSWYAPSSLLDKLDEFPKEVADPVAGLGRRAAIFDTSSGEGGVVVVEIDDRLSFSVNVQKVLDRDRAVSVSRRIADRLATVEVSGEARRVLRSVASCQADAGRVFDEAFEAGQDRESEDRAVATRDALDRLGADLTGPPTAHQPGAPGRGRLPNRAPARHRRASALSATSRSSGWGGAPASHDSR